MSDYIQIADISGHHIDYVQIADISGNHSNVITKMHKNDFYCLCMKDTDKNIGLRKKGMIIFRDTDTSLEYLCSDFVRFCLSLFKNKQHNDMQMIPIKAIPISEELKQYIEEFLPDYYGNRI